MRRPVEITNRIFSLAAGKFALDGRSRLMGVCIRLPSGLYSRMHCAGVCTTGLCAPAGRLHLDGRLHRVPVCMGCLSTLDGCLHQMAVLIGWLTWDGRSQTPMKGGGLHGLGILNYDAHSEAICTAQVILNKSMLRLINICKICKIQNFALIYHANVLL